MLHGGKELICWLLFLMLKHWCMSKQGILYLSATWNGSHWIPSALWRIWVSCWSISLNIDKPTKGAISGYIPQLLLKRINCREWMGGICWELRSHINVNPSINNNTVWYIHTFTWPTLPVCVGNWLQCGSETPIEQILYFARNQFHCYF